ncbi:phage tail protein [Serratia marcescens]|uniref:phage tail protein n=1 Tax=Serratia marcescens TaxID=615 RepID=UPI001573B941|nr:phage tail protein [Serratia marcescens]NSM16773.1 phage tail protein [Serratia marcescens]NSM97039.1 phage tail protein [Serratia marcescens]
MSEKKYSAVITAAGAEKLANAAVTGTPIAIKEMAVGDGGGRLPRPSTANAGLIGEKYRGELNKLMIADSDASVIEAEMIMPPQIGGFWLRELALYADDGECVAVGNMPETYKPLLAEGSGRFQIIRMQLKVSSTANVELIADPSVILATAEDVKGAEDAAKDYTDEAIGELGESVNKAIAAAVKTAIRDAWEQDNPVGSSRLFNQNVNPNTKWPWSTWEYAGEHLTIRTAKADGSDVGTQGGSDTVSITRANLPQSVLNVSGSTSEQGAQTLKTTPAGRHKHQGGMDAPGEPWDFDYIVGSDNDSHRKRNYTSETEDHIHEVTVPAHAHTVWAQTEALGQGQAISVVERHKLQMLWHRVA